MKKSELCLLPLSCGILVGILLSFKNVGDVFFPKRRLAFGGLHGVIYPIRHNSSFMRLDT
jgi:hypothetical protein